MRSSWLSVVWSVVSAGVLIAAEENRLVVTAATGPVVIDDTTLMAQAVGVWRVETGSTVETKGGFAELEVSEGVWVRLGPESALRTIEQSTEVVDLEVLKGLVTLDAVRNLGVNEIRVRLGEATLVATRKGEYLIDAQSKSLGVLKGRAEVRRDGESIPLKSKRAVLDGDSAAQKLAIESAAALHKWRKERNDAFIIENRREPGIAERAMRPAK